MTFKIGSTLLGLQDLEDIFYLDGPGEPDWSYQPFSKAVVLGNGQVKGQGFPVAKWRWNGMSALNREILKAFVGSDLSATVYIETATNETSGGVVVFDQFQAIMRWPAVEEDFQINRVLAFVLIFTNLVPQA